MINGAIARILLRYGAGALAMYGIMSNDWADMISTDPDISALVEIGIAGGIAFATERFYVYAKRQGWSL